LRARYQDQKTDPMALFIDHTIVSDSVQHLLPLEPIVLWPRPAYTTKLRPEQGVPGVQAFHVSGKTTDTAEGIMGLFVPGLDDFTPIRGRCYSGPLFEL
jgi:hypothetical protein